ncbi:MAG: tRNA uridine-5-carboxymethylaminomethyl(34) synthesis GTPase MnmE [Alphaproteobacteria bacterium]
MSETIYALASAPGRAGVALVRVSGPDSFKSLSVLAGEAVYTPRKAVLRKLTAPQTGELIDHALILPFKAPASYTGEDIVEYHLHGGVAVVEALLAALAACPGHRLAAPGEFTRRAFENGRMDLTEAEAVADLINAETQAQRHQALLQMEGALSRLYQGWSHILTQNLAHLEADIEFPDEDLPEGISPQIRPVIEDLITQISAHLDDNRRGERLRSGVHIAVIGAPNAGKSSLVNALAQRDVAIVSALAGTTRDIVEIHLDLGGYPAILADTAGLRPEQIGQEGQESIESEGIRRALKRAEEADIRLLLFDGTQKMPDAHTLALCGERAVIALNKADCGLKMDRDAFGGHPVVSLSVQTGEGLEALTGALLARIKNLIGLREAPSLTRARHREALEEAKASLSRSLTAPLQELSAEDLRLALRALGRITGRVSAEDLLDVIFSDFCIGK